MTKQNVSKKVKKNLQNVTQTDVRGKPRTLSEGKTEKMDIKI